jgi:RNA polymerase sigma-70 factor, ECF subfamily
MTDETTRALLAAQDGDPAGFERFVQLTLLDVTRYCRYLGSSDTYEDLVQDTYLRALRSLGGYRHESPALRWLLTIARRACADAIEQRKRANRTAFTPEPVHDHAAATDLELLLDSLTDDQRTAFVLTQLLGYGYEEAAALCECPIGTIRSRVARARSALHDRVSGSERQRPPATA